MVRFLLLAAVLAVLGLTAKLFVWPVENSPARADAVVVLAGSKPRLTKGLELMRRRVAPTLVISDGLAPKWPEANRLCRNDSARFRVVCFRPNPYSTRGEAQRVGRMARNRRWRTVILVTSTYHVTRARLLFKRCLDGRVRAVSAGYSLTELPQNVFWEWVKLAAAETVERGCGS
jgi:uncharacterized SAM-binding protein YcdF (DUF218 family)